MAVSKHFETTLETELFADAYDRVHAIEDKILSVFPDAKFRLIPGPDEERQLHVFTGQGATTDVTNLVQDEQRSLAEDYHLMLYVIPLRLTDLEGATYRSRG